MSTNDADATKPKRPGPISRVLSPIRGRLIGAAVLAAVGTALTLVPLAGIAHLAKIILGNADLSPMTALDVAQRESWQTVIISLVSLFVGLTLVSTAELMAHLADNRITHHLRLAATRRLAQVPLGWFTSRASGEVKQAMQDDIGTLHDLTAHFYTTVGRTVGAILVSLIYLFAMDWRMALASLVPFLLFFVIFGTVMKSIESNTQALATRQTNVNNSVVEFVNGIPVIKAFGTSGKAHSNYQRAIDDFLDTFLGVLRPLVGRLATANAVVAPVAVLGIVLAFGTLFVTTGWIAPVDILPFVLVAPGICAPLMLLAFVAHGLGPAQGAAERVQALLQTPVLEQLPQDQLRQPVGSELRIDQVSYAYDLKNKVVSNLSFTLQPGTVTAIVGSSGAGKSTLARLLLRFFDPTEGRITLGGIDLRHIEVSELYRRIGFVLQEVQLIHTTVFENIALGRPSASRQEIEDAAHAANIHERILSLPRGYDSVIGEDAQLSGGEQQRISLARAVLLDPPVLILDEATAAADAESEVAIQEALSRFAQGRTLLVIAHRLDTVRHADHIIVIENGELHEQGHHVELMAKNGRYAQLWALGGYEKNHPQAVPSC